VKHILDGEDLCCSNFNSNEAIPTDGDMGATNAIATNSDCYYQRKVSEEKNKK